MNIVTDPDIQALSGWQFHKGTEGNVAATAPLSYSMDQTSYPPWAKFSIAGAVDKTKVAGVDAYLARPIPPNKNRLCAHYVIYPDVDSVLNANSHENDVILTDAHVPNRNYNGSLQNDCSQGGILQISNPSAGWVSIGSGPGIYTPNMDHDVRAFYAFDFTKGTMIFQNIVVDDVNYVVPPNIATIPGTPKGWTNTMQVMVQLQQMLTIAAGAAGKGYSVTYKHVNLIWSQQ